MGTIPILSQRTWRPGYGKPDQGVKVSSQRRPQPPACSPDTKAPPLWLAVLSPACSASTFPSSKSQKFVSPLFVLMGAQVFPESSRIWRSSENPAKSLTLECAQLLGNRTIIAPLCSFLCCCFKREKNGGGMKFTVSMKKQEKYFHAQGKS